MRPAILVHLTVIVLALGRPPLAHGQERDWPPKPTVEGEWSEPVNQLRGRLLFADVQNSAGIRQGVVYLELQNFRRLDLDVYYVFVPASPDGQRGGDELPPEASVSSLHCEVLDKDGRKHELSGASGFRGNVPSTPRWLFLPRGATLRFPVSLTGYAWPASTELGFGIGIGRDRSWLIAKGAESDDYFLVGTLNIRPPANREGRTSAWEGTLKLPAIKLPIVKSE